MLGEQFSDAIVRETFYISHLLPTAIDQGDRSCEEWQQTRAMNLDLMQVKAKDQLRLTFKFCPSTTSFP